MKILITGVAGFIGSHLARKCLLAFPKADIKGYDNLSSGRLENIQNVDIQFDYVVSDGYPIYDFEKFDIVFHLASNTDTGDNDINRQFKNNIDSYEYATTYVKDGGVFICASSAGVYGNEKMASSNGYSEYQKINPPTRYAYSKAQLERRGRTDFNKINHIYTRFFNIYGENEDKFDQSTCLLTKIIRNAVNNGKINLFEGTLGFRRDFLHVDDLCDRVIALATATIKNKTKKSYEIFNIGSGVSVSNEEILQFLTENNVKFNIAWLNRSAKYLQAIQNNTKSDNTKLINYLGELPLEIGWRAGAEKILKKCLQKERE